MEPDQSRPLLCLLESFILETKLDTSRPLFSTKESLIVFSTEPDVGLVKIKYPRVENNDLVSSS